ncbi:MAG: class II aldolase/adducin family protein [Deltaproteobacteria bacterium]|nr:class II aldolase/adducin family protein [Deltaproteobacteria bacterium]
MAGDLTQLKTRLVEASRILEQEDLFDVFGHVSARLPEGDRILITPSMAPGDIKPEDLIIMDLQGKKLAGEGEPVLEHWIHTSIYRLRQDVQAVVHAHPLLPVAFTLADEPLKPMRLGDGKLSEGIPAYPGPGEDSFIVTEELGMGMARALGDRPALLLRGHGIVAVGDTIETASLMAIRLNHVASHQLLAMVIRGARHLMQQESLATPKILDTKKTRWRDWSRVWEYYRMKLKKGA